MFHFFRKRERREEDEKSTIQKEDFNNVEPISKYFYNETGITFDKQISILKNKLISFCKQRKIYSFYMLLQNIKTTLSLKQELIDYLTTNETYFYREFAQIEELIGLVKDENKAIKILCAPVATGEESYSIAIALLEAGVKADRLKIVGIDINQEALNTAQVAIYAERSVRNLSSNLINKYFTVANNQYILKEDIRSLVSYKLANIFDDSFKELGKFDFVFSRNMLIYFDKETKQRAKAILESMRKDSTHDVFFGHADLF